MNWKLLVCGAAVGVAVAVPSHAAELYTFKDETGIGKLLAYLSVLAFISGDTTRQLHQGHKWLPGAVEQQSPGRSFCFSHTPLIGVYSSCASGVPLPQ